VTNLVLCVIALVLSPDDDRSWIEAYANIQCGIII